MGRRGRFAGIFDFVRLVHWTEMRDLVCVCVFVFESLMLLCRPSFRPFVCCQSVVICRFRMRASLLFFFLLWRRSRANGRVGVAVIIALNSSDGTAVVGACRRERVARLTPSK